MHRKLNVLLTCILCFLALRALSAPTKIYAADCSEASPGGDMTITTACAFAGTVNGVDSGSGATNSAVLTVASGSTLTVGGLQSLAMGSISLSGGTIVIIDGGSFHLRTPLWVTDADGDQVPDSLTQIASSTQPTNAVRRNTLPDLSVADANPNEYCPANYDPPGTCNYCLHGAITNESDASDIFGECTLFHACSGSGSCTLHAKRVFISSTTSKGNLGGITGADSLCQNLASTASLSGTWLSWTSSTTASASSRFTHATQPYILTDEQTKLADNWTGLTSGTLQTNIDKDELVATVAGGSTAWTNTNADGSLVSSVNGETCTSWGANGGNGIFGTNDSTASAAWANDTTGSCGTARHLYCIEQ